MKKPCAPGNGSDVPCPGLGDEIVAPRYPFLWEHLTETKWEDGSRREPSSITIFLDQGWLKACLNDKSGGLVAFVSSASFMGLLGALEDGLMEGTLEWRRAREGKGKK